MLSTLRIQNFALIDSLTLNFQDGYTVLTGETGSGKSILLGALNLILGERADFSVIGPVSDKAVIEAEFDISNFEVGDFFQVNDIDVFNPILLRREINKQGRSRAFINDTPVQLTVLKELTEKLVHIHSQHNTLELRRPNFQLSLVDTLAGLNKEQKQYSALFYQWNAVRKELEKLQEKQALSLQQSDYNRFQLEELSELNLTKNDFQSLENELRRNENVGDLKDAFLAVMTAIENEEGAASTLRKLKPTLEKTKGMDEDLDQLSERIVGALIELQDISTEAERQLDKIEVDPQRLNELLLILDQYNRILRKHNLQTQEQLIDLERQLSDDFEETEGLDALIEEKSSMVQQLRIDCEKMSADLHKRRVASAIKSEEAVKELLTDLKLPDTQFVFEFTERQELNEKGASDVKVLFSPNKGMSPVSIEKAASGGELSRLMLALQNLISVQQQLPTMIFDEIDTGVSGEVAQKIGMLLRKMGQNLQLISITHLPQVAGKANYHFKVEKGLKDARTHTSVRLLNEAERVEEIARLMSGTEINEAALANAKALMN